MVHLSACLAALRERGTVLHAEHIAHRIIGIGIVHDGACLAVHREVLQPATLRVVTVESLGSVAVFEVGALLELVIAYLAHIVVAV